ncbi:MAG: MFS transporter [Candidatus Korarchaeota archaeon]|nr:MFS transporter [Candidatus Korarchaeota archaeon]
MLIVVSALSGACGAMIDVVTQPMLLELGASVYTIGLLFTLGGYSGLIPTLVQPMGGVLSDSLGRRPFVLLMRLATAAAMTCYLAAALTGSLRLALLAISLFGLSAIGWPAWDAAVAESSPAHGRGMAYSAVLLAGVAPGLLMRPIGGVLADRIGYWSVYLVGLAGEAACLVVLLSAFREGTPPRARSVSLRGLLRRVFTPPKDLWRFYILTGLDSLLWGVSMGVLPAIVVSQFEVSNLELGVLTTVLSATIIASQIPVGVLIDRIGPVKVLALSQALGVPLAVTLLRAEGFAHLIPAYATLGLAASTWVPTTRAYLSLVVESDDVAGSMGRLSAFDGLFGFAAPALGGALYELYGLKGPVTVTLAGSLALAAGFALLLEEVKRPAGQVNIPGSEGEQRWR